MIQLYIKDGDYMNYIYESDRIGFIKLNDKYKSDYIKMYLDEKIQQKMFIEKYSEDQITKWVENILKGNNNNYVMVSKDNHSFLGNIELIIKDNVATIMLAIVPNMQNQHYGTEAIKATLKFHEEKYNIKEYGLYVYKTNFNAIHCYEKLGFKIDGDGFSKENVHMKLK